MAARTKLTRNERALLERIHRKLLGQGLRISSTRILSLLVKAASKVPTSKFVRLIRKELPRTAKASSVVPGDVFLSLGGRANGSRRCESFEPLWDMVLGAEKKGDLPLAVRFASQLIALEDTTEARMCRARLLARLREIRAAITDLAHVLAKDPLNAVALFQRAHLYLYEAAFERAEADLVRALEINPKSPHLLQAYGVCLAHIRDQSALEKAFLKFGEVPAPQPEDSREIKRQLGLPIDFPQDGLPADYVPSAPKSNASGWWRPGMADEPDTYEEGERTVDEGTHVEFPVVVKVDPRALIGLRLKATIDLEFSRGTEGNRFTPMGDGLDSMLDM